MDTAVISCYVEKQLWWILLFLNDWDLLSSIRARWVVRSFLFTYTCANKHLSARNISHLIELCHCWIKWNMSLVHNVLEVSTVKSPCWHGRFWFGKSRYHLYSIESVRFDYTAIIQSLHDSVLSDTMELRLQHWANATSNDIVEIVFAAYHVVGEVILRLPVALASTFEQRIWIGCISRTTRWWHNASSRPADCLYIYIHIYIYIHRYRISSWSVASYSPHAYARPCAYICPCTEATI